MDLIRGAHAALIADLTGLSTWSPFCDVGLDINSRTCSGISSVADMCLIIWSVIFLMFFVCGELKLNMSGLSIPSLKTSAHNVW